MKPATLAAERAERPLSLEARLHCPYCGIGLTEEDRFSAASRLSCGDYGVFRCGCSRYPMLEGIPIVQQVAGLREIVELVQKRQANEALLRALNAFRVTWARRTRWHQIHYLMSCRRLTSREDVTFEESVALVRKPRGFADYLMHRYANPSFFGDVALLPTLGAFLTDGRGPRDPDGHVRRRRILDLGCGAGHSSFLVSQWFPDADVVSADQDFVSLYLAKRFLAPTAECVCADAEVPSPFPDRWFDAVHCLDAFHYFRSKRAIVAELRRIVDPSGLWVFPHLHNALQDNVAAGIPLSPADYGRCFDFLDPTFFDERDLLRHRGRDGIPPGLAGGDVAKLSSAPSVALVGGGRHRLLEPRSAVSWLSTLGARLRVNPIYRGAWRGDTLKLGISWPSRELQRECSAAVEVLPPTCEIPRRALVKLISEGNIDDPLIRELIERFVLVLLPDQYSRTDLLAAIPRPSCA